MAFRIELLVENELPRVLRTPSLEYIEVGLSPHDELVQLIAAQCRALARTRGVTFLVGGFGQDHWPVDVETDLAVVIEQLPRATSDLRERGCSLRWSPNPAIEVASFAETEMKLEALRRTHAASTSRVCPWLSRPLLSD